MRTFFFSLLCIQLGLSGCSDPVNDEQVKQISGDSLVIELTPDFALVYGNAERFDSFVTYSSLTIKKGGKKIHSNSSYEFETGNKSFPSIRSLSGGHWEVLIEVNNRPGRNFLYRVIIDNKLNINADTLPLFIASSSDLDGDNQAECAGYWSEAEVWGKENVFTAYNPILYYRQTEKGLMMDHVLTETRNIAIYGAFYGYHYNDTIEVSSECLKRFRNECHFIMLHGRWTSEEDSLAEVVVSGGKWIFLYKGQEDEYFYTMDTGDACSDSSSSKNEAYYLKLKSEQDTLCYEILSLDDQKLKLLYLPAGKLLTYKKNEGGPHFVCFEDGHAEALAGPYSNDQVNCYLMDGVVYCHSWSCCCGCGQVESTVNQILIDKLKLVYANSDFSM